MAEYNIKLCMGCMEPKDSEGVCPLCGYSPDVPSLPEYLSPGTFLNDRYIVGKLLRFNGEGADYIGFDTVTSSKVTIREYMPDTLCSRAKDSPVIAVKQNSVVQYKAFMSEFVELNKMLAKMRTLGHINPAIDMFGDNNTGYVIFRYIEGMNLGKYLKEHAGELTWDEVKKLFPPIFTTLSLIHNAGLVHRGISPDNIIVDEKGELKLIGFCIADARTANTELASEVYSGYAAPEQYSSSNWQGTWTDVYGICALLYRILTGTAPTDAMERLANDTLLPPKSLNNNIPANVSKVIMNGMNLSGELRIQTVTELVTQLFEEPEFNKPRPASQTQTISIPKQHSTQGPVSKPQPSKKQERMSRRKMFVIVAIAAAVVVFTGMAILMMTLDDNSSQITNAITTAETAASAPEASESSVITDESGSEIVTEPPATAAETADPSTLPTLAVIETSSVSDSASEQTTIKPGATVYIMNDLVGKNFDTVKNSSANENLTIIPEYIYTDEYEKGIIFAQSIEKGSNYEKGSEVTLKISMGPAKVIVPEFFGLNKKDYFDLLNAAGIKYEEKPYETEKTLHDYVAWISVEPGEYIDLEAGEILYVHVAVNPENTAPPETTTVSETTSELSSAWVTTSVPEITLPNEEPTTQPTVFTEEPDITISLDY
ncbi:MAG: PASTA domain-containing protein [Oscillospiraceae bacterium]|nr:PASTA domain-containing protein [Oscillospiraceae bacterium]